MADHKNPEVHDGSERVSVLGLVKRYRWRVAVTFFLVLLEAVGWLLFPLFLGFAVNSLIDDSLAGVIALTALGATALVVGSIRRLYDTRAYAHIYVEIADEMVAREKHAGSEISTVTARSNLLREFVEFLENSMPEIVNNVIGVVGTLIILGGINRGVFLAALGLLVVVVVTYWVTSGANFRLNKGYNDELERQVDTLKNGGRVGVRSHFERLMRWNIRLSDLETGNYAVFFTGVIALLFCAPIALATDGVSVGVAIAGLMYVFQYMESLAAMPLFIQQVIRLREISKRLEMPGGEVADAGTARS